MNQEERIRFKKIYEEEISEEELIKMALVDPQEYEEGIYELVIKAIEKRGLSEKINEIKQGVRSNLKDECWIEVYRFYEEAEKSFLEVCFRDKNIPFDIISRECSAYDGVFKALTGAGIIRVKESYVEKAKELLEDIKRTKQTGTIVLTVDLITEVIIKVLERRNISNKEDIVKEIIQEIQNRESNSI